MACLSVYHQSTPDIPNKVLTHLEDIAATLAEQGVGLERLEVGGVLQPGASEAEVLEALRAQVDQLMTAKGFAEVKVLSLDGEQPPGLLDEHRHGSDELRLTVGGRGQLSLRIGEYVYVLLCEKHELLTVPAGTLQWFDAGESPRVIVVRMFREAGSAAVFTGEGTSSLYPRLDY